MSQIEIQTSGQGSGTTTAIDGRQLQDVRSIEIVIETGEVTKLIITKFLRKEDGSYTLQPDEQVKEGVVGLIQEFNFSGSFSLNGVLMSEETQVL